MRSSMRDLGTAMAAVLDYIVIVEKGDVRPSRDAKMRRASFGHRELHKR